MFMHGKVHNIKGAKYKKRVITMYSDIPFRYTKNHFLASVSLAIKA